MSQQFTASRARRFPLSVLISVLLVLTAIIPLLVTVSSIVIFLRPALISQISTDMETTAQTHMQLIDTYLAERLNDVKTLSEATAIKGILQNDPNSRTAASDMLFTVLHRDVADYINISLLNAQGNVVLSYPTVPQMHGKYLVQPDAPAQMAQSGKIFVSDVFYDPVANNPSVDLYARVVSANFQTLGIVRASLGLHRLWQAVDSEPQNSGADSYAFVLDQHGVRIAYTNPDHSGFTHPGYLFKSVAPLTPDFQQRIKDEDLYGNSVTTVSSTEDTALANVQNNPQSSPIFQMKPVGQDQTFEVARFSSTVVSWTYYLLKPLSTVTGLADQQLYSVVFIVLLMLILAVIIGVRFGRGITLPIMRSVSQLRKNSVSLKTLADDEQIVATQQTWMVEASQVAMKSIKYYTAATRSATERLTTLCAYVTQQEQHSQDQRLKSALKEMATTVAYIEQAIGHQESANDKLMAALRVTTQASEQLTNGAKSTDDAATQLEQVVSQLTAVVGEGSVNTEEQTYDAVSPAR